MKEEGRGGEGRGVDEEGRGGSLCCVSSVIIDSSRILF